MQTTRPTASRSCVDRGGLGVGAGLFGRASDAAAPRRRRASVGHGRPAALPAAARGLLGVPS